MVSILFAGMTAVITGYRKKSVCIVDAVGMISFKKFLGVSETVRTEFDSLNEWRAKSARLNCNCTTEMVDIIKL